MKRRKWIGVAGAAAILGSLVGGSALADETVSIGGSRAVLIKPAAPRASVILMPGANGAIAAGDHGDIHALNFNQLVRTRQAYAARGLAVLVVDAGTPLDGAVQYMAAIKRPVTVIATSRGTIRAAEGIRSSGLACAYSFNHSPIATSSPHKDSSSGVQILPCSHPASGSEWPRSINGQTREK